MKRIPENKKKDIPKKRTYIKNTDKNILKVRRSEDKEAVQIGVWISRNVYKELKKLNKELSIFTSTYVRMLIISDLKSKGIL